MRCHLKAENYKKKLQLHSRECTEQAEITSREECAEDIKQQLLTTCNGRHRWSLQLLELNK